MKLGIGIASFIGGLVACYLLFSMGFLRKIDGIPAIPNDPGQSVSIYLSFIGVMMTAVTAVLAALAIGIGIVAAYTFSGLKNEAKLTADNTARQVSEVTAREVSSEALSEVKIKGIVEAYLAVYVRQTEQEAEWGPEAGEPEER